MIYTETLQTVAVSFQAVAVILQGVFLYLLYHQVRADHLRRMKQSTLEKIIMEYSDARFQLETQYGHNYLSDENVTEIVKDKEKYALLTRFMGTLEYICTGINTGVYDSRMVYRLAGTSFIRNYHLLGKLIEYRRKNESPKICIELQIVATEFERIKTEEISQGKSFGAELKTIFTKKS